MNALVTDTNAGSMPVIGMPSTVRPASPMWHGATFQTRFPLRANHAGPGLFRRGDLPFLWGDFFDWVGRLGRGVFVTKPPNFLEFFEILK